ncbi:M16 family metallopeptidase [Auraticoccus monumenti]|uniref:Predicted Zn-dependent peptidase n=1 Tax=Auraticoccus monumenti TaxID=675864 RepID=A0A1G7APN5_9ACTN|nr:pitrilysin family protein [Auraticoccus monumenti]SDE16752.1 Predicted Zn-dependent peptidase [Auraticoccus monumenti]
MPEARPDVGTPPPLPISTATLDNGLRVVVSPDHAVPSVTVNLWYDVGSRHESPGRSGFAHLFEHVMFQGSTHVGRSQHIALVQACGGTANATTSFDRTNYFQTVPLGALDLALWLEADRLGGLLDALTQASLDNQREVVKEEKRQRYDNVPYGDVLQRLVELTFPADHPYGHTTIGSMDDLDAASLSDVQDFFRTHYLPSNAVLTVVGDVTPEAALDAVRAEFDALPATARPPHASPAPLPPITGSPRDEVTAAVPADAVHLTWRLPALDQRAFDAADLGLGVLGDGLSARLHRRLVRADESAEAAGASSLGLVGGNSFAFVSARARDGVDVAAVEATLLEEVDRLRADGPTEGELSRVVAQFERSWLQSLSRIDSRADQLGRAATLLGDPAQVDARIAQVRSITPEQVRDAAREWLDPASCGTLVHRQEA